MPKYLTLNEAFLKCKREGCIIPIDGIDLDKIRTDVSIAESDADSADTLKLNLDRNSPKWNSIFKLYYDAMHELASAFVRFDSFKSDNHQCLFAFLCEKHPELEFSWEFFEKFRTKRNGINYYSSPVFYDDWHELELQYFLYHKKLKQAVLTKLDGK